MKSLKGGVSVDTHNDHRMVMLTMLAATLCEEPVTVQQVEALNKSWPTFPAVFAALGGRME